MREVGRESNLCFVGPSGSGKTYKATNRRYSRIMSVYVDPTGDIQIPGETVTPNEALNWVAVDMADPRRGGHRVVDASGIYRDGGLGPYVEMLVAAMNETGKLTRRRSTVILDEVADIVIQSRSAGRKSDMRAVNTMVRASKTGRHTGLSAWFVTQRVQEIPRSAGTEATLIFGVGDQREWNYYYREVGGVELKNALRSVENHRARTGEYPYVEFRSSPIPDAEMDPMGTGCALEWVSPTRRVIIRKGETPWMPGEVPSIPAISRNDWTDKNYMP